MILKKVYNNNIVLCTDENDEDVILIGLGIAFQKKVGQQIDEEKIERKFVLDSNEVISKYNNVLKDMPINYLMITDQIVKYAQKQLQTTFHDDVYISICDHIRFAIRRFQNNQLMKNALLWEIKKYYSKEFETAKEALKIIEREENIVLGEDEAGFIALHFVNANNNEMNITIKQLKMVEEIMKIVKTDLKIAVTENNLNYQRFIIHLRFLIRRLFENKFKSEDNDLLILDLVKNEYAKEYICAENISRYLEKSYEVKLSNNEKIYLTLHLYRMSKNEG